MNPCPDAAELGIRLAQRGVWFRVYTHRMNSNLDRHQPTRKQSLDDEDVAKTLAEFSRVCVAVAKMIQEGPGFSHLDRLTIENNLAVVQLNYTYWVRKFDDQRRTV